MGFGAAAECESSAAERAMDHWRTVAAVLHLGQLQFEPLEASSADPGSQLTPSCAEACTTASQLLGCPAEGLVRALTARRIMGVASSRTPREAAVARDTLLG